MERDSIKFVRYMRGLCRLAADSMTVAVVVGHHPDAPGAELTLEGHTVTEHDLWLSFAREMWLSSEGMSCLTVSPVERPEPNPRTAAEAVTALDVDVAIELHFNAAEDSAAHGCEMLYYPGSDEGKRLAKLLQEWTTDALGVEDRGVKARGDLAFLSGTEVPAVICEPAFGTNPADAFSLLTGQADLMGAYRQALIEYDLAP